MKKYLIYKFKEYACKYSLLSCMIYKKGMRYSRCSSIDQTNCTSEQECVGYMGTTDLILKGYCSSRKF